MHVSYEESKTIFWLFD